MQTELAARFSGVPEGVEADQILRACVHCGFCTATCPTYRLLGDERDSPRGRIYLIKNLLEGHEPSGRTQLHLDRCLGCRGCETTCPSGVRYGRLLDIGRETIERQVQRPLLDRLQRWLILKVLPDPDRFAPPLRAAQLLRPLLPARLRRRIPPRAAAGTWPDGRHHRRMLLVDGCVQPLTAPSINAAAARVLDKLGIGVIRASGCCGALAYHLPKREAGLAAMRRNIDAWLPMLDQGCEAIVATASGCGLMVKEYGQALRHDPAYAAKAARISAMVFDLAEILAREDLTPLRATPALRLACHIPCTLQHGQGIRGLVERILSDLGFTLTEATDGETCCGSAGSYSLLQPDLSSRLLALKLDALHASAPDNIVTANIGCLLHLQSGTDTPVRHWIEAVDAALPPTLS
jgi:glycolate oxidase iron-sulfur subunit